MISPPAVLRVLVLAGACALAGCQPSKPVAKTHATAEATLPPGCVVGETGLIGGPISLIDQSGAPATQANFQEAPALIYFGYTSCPDICPFALQMEKTALAKLGQTGQVVQPVMITLDPARDTPKVMAAYVASAGFPEGLLGLTGSPAQIAAAAKAFRVAYQKDPDAGSAGQYSVSHTSFFYLMDEDWRLSALFPSTFSPDQAARCLKAGLKHPESPA